VKELLIIVYAIIPFFTLAILTGFIEANYFDKHLPKHSYQLVIGISLILSGLWAYFTSNYYKNDEGEKNTIGRQ
jgi:energy-coupling factor transporter transmembrane protein EcfT